MTTKRIRAEDLASSWASGGRRESVADACRRDPVLSLYVVLAFCDAMPSRWVAEVAALIHLVERSK